MTSMKLSVIIPAYNEENSIAITVKGLEEALTKEMITYEIIIVNDNSTDGTPAVISDLMKANPYIKTVNRTPPGGFGRALRSGFEVVRGDAVVICMGDCSDDPKDVVKYFRKLEEGYDCVFGSRFIKGSVVEKYPKVKLVVNRIVNKMIQWMFRCKFNDLTNAFKAYRSEVIYACGPYRGCHFNMTLELSLSPLIRKYSIAQIPINWYGRSWGSTNLSLRRMGRRYLETLLKIYAEKLLISDDIEEEALAYRRKYEVSISEISKRLEALEEKVNQLDKNS